MAYQSKRPTNDTTTSGTREASIEQKDEGFEIVLPSALDDELTFFVTDPKAKLDAPKPRPVPTELFDDPETEKTDRDS
ncbi:MAG TPA: hypothetical protein VNC78_08855 [Actinomycetota bacterium]|nr:hypothetical protein [Actinomycetota bacterium]